ncbi:hypothetical protein [Paenibacillus sp. KN14-4R]|uniref:hypothetical protein n=1 Tax=Paenibacillus sp. KN14-4R TaxID=3445773 RepID=UPI003FA14A20
MTIISIEGASAVGKTTTSAELSKIKNAFHIPEVAMLWKKPEQEYPEWFFERQLYRWNIAVEQEQSKDLVVVDIDLFQPLWYNWSFNFSLFNGQSLEFVEKFYRPMLIDKRIGFPDMYFLLYTNEDNLRKRKLMDSTRLRRGFELNLKFIEPQQRYFQALNNKIPGLVHFIESESIEQNIEEINKKIESCNNNHRYSVELFDFITEWLSSNQAISESGFEEGPTIL